jgi:hypothetical protein
VDTDYVLGLLLERGQFNIARKYASIVNSTTSQVTLKEVKYDNRVNVLSISCMHIRLSLILIG